MEKKIEEINAIIKQLKIEKSQRKRIRLFLKLVEMGKDAVMPILELFEEEKWFLRASAARTLGEIGEATNDVYSKLTEYMENDPNEMVRFNAAWSLAKIFEDTENTFTIINNAANEGKNKNVKIYFLLALYRIKGKNSVIEKEILDLIENKEVSLEGTLLFQEVYNQLTLKEEMAILRNRYCKSDSEEEKHEIVNEIFSLKFG